MDRSALVNAFISGSPISITGPVAPNKLRGTKGGVVRMRGIISSLEREDGSGYSFNVVLDTAEEGKVSMYVRCTR